MNPLSLIGLGLFMGIVFGFALEKSKMFEPRALIRQMQLKNFLMLKVFLTAMMVSAIVVFTLIHFHLATFHIKGYHWLENSIGGLILGFGIVLAGACPGTVFVQLGVGYRDAIFVFLGGLFGTFIYAYYEPLLKSLYPSQSQQQTLMSWFHIPHWAALIGFIMVAFIILLLLEARASWKSEINQISEV